MSEFCSKCVEKEAQMEIVMNKFQQEVDALKKRIGGILESIPPNERQANSAVSEVYSGLKKTISDQAPTYNKVKADVWNLLGKLPVGKDFTRAMAHKLTEGIKGALSSSSNLFEALNIRYFGCRCDWLWHH